MSYDVYARLEGFDFFQNDGVDLIFQDVPYSDLRSSSRYDVQLDSHDIPFERESQKSQSSLRIQRIVVHIWLVFRCKTRRSLLSDVLLCTIWPLRHDARRDSLFKVIKSNHGNLETFFEQRLGAETKLRHCSSRRKAYYAK